MFYKLFTEMAIMKGDYDTDTFSHENEWYYDYQNDKKTKLIAENSDYNLYKTEYIMFIIDLDNDYVGSIEYNQIGKTIHIETAHSTLKKDFYKNLFELLFKKYKEIRSDHVLSANVFKAYTKLSKKYKMIVKDTDGIEYEFNKKNLFVDAEDFDSRIHSRNLYYRNISIKK